MNLLESIQKETKDITNKSYQISFKTNALEYQSLLSGFNKKIFDLILRAENWLETNTYKTIIIKWETKAWGEIPADFGRK